MLYQTDWHTKDIKKRNYRITTWLSKEIFEHQFYTSLEEAQQACERFAANLPKMVQLHDGRWIEEEFAKEHGLS